MSTIFLATVPDFIVEVLIRGDWSDLVESRLLPTLREAPEGICSKKASSMFGADGS